MTGVPAWFGGPTRRALHLGLGVAAVALLCGWPYWRDQVAAAAITLLGCGGFAAAGILLRQRTGVAFLFASVAWALTWTASWNSGVFPLISVFAQSTFYLALGYGVLAYSEGRLVRFADRSWVAAAIAVLFGGQTLLCVTSRPEWNGFAATVAWPSPMADPSLFDVVQRISTALVVALAGGLVVLLVLRTRLQRPLGLLVAVAVAVAVLTAVASQGTLVGSDVRLDHVLGVYLVQGTAALALPLVFLGTDLRARLAELTVAERMQRLIDPGAGPVSVERVRDALRAVVRDDTLEVWFWVPEEDVLVGIDGEPGPSEPVGGRWRREVRTASDELLAIVEVSDTLRERPSLVEAALLAGGRALETARLQATARAHLERARAARARLVRVHAVERERLANELHDGAQRRLRALAFELSRLEEAAGSDGRERVRALRRELVDAIGELGDLARGVHPALLASAGLGPALAAVVQRTAGPSISLDVLGRRLAPELEATLYFAVCEALTNAVKHARAQRIGIRVRSLEGRIVAEVEDDGIGMPSPAPTGGGLTGMTDRVAALNGAVDIVTSEAGTTVRITLPDRAT